MRRAGSGFVITADHGKYAASVMGGKSAFRFTRVARTGQGASGKIQFAVEEMNRALETLGVTGFRVSGILSESQPGEEVGRWVVTLASTADSAKTYSMQWSGNAA